MRMIKSAIAGILALSAVATATAQQFPTVPAQTVIGRLGIPGDTGPSQAIPFARFLPNLTGIQSANKVFVGPTSGGQALPSFRLLVGADLPVPGASSLGGVQSSTCTTSNWFNTLSTSGVFGCSQPNFTDLAGSIAAGQIPAAVVALTKLATQNNNTVVGNVSGGAASPVALSQTQLTALINAATASLAGALPAFPGTTTTYFRGDGTYVTHNCAALSDSSVGCNAARGQLPGETTTGSATAGNVGEYVEGVVALGSAVSLTTGTTTNITSISLTAGDWDVAGNISYVTAATTSITQLIGTISLTTATIDLTNGRAHTLTLSSPTVPTGGTTLGTVLQPVRFSLSATTTIFLVARPSFTASTLTGYGILRARRVR